MFLFLYRFVDDFKSYFKWIIFIDVIVIQIILALAVYLLIKVTKLLIILYNI